MFANGPPHFMMIQQFVLSLLVDLCTTLTLAPSISRRQATGTEEGVTTLLLDAIFGARLSQRVGTPPVSIFT
ncbi:hypothetical protein C8J57DRAFT_1318774 [Mycena rebaudengoi]|nr:hypothetical protein C8J57DRAFT_1318774 [Mycena rebaudengoi]